MASSSCLPKGLALGPASSSRGRVLVRAPICASLNEQNAMSRRAAILLSASPLLLASATLPARAAFIDMTDVRKTGAKEGMDSADQARDDNEDARKRFAFQSYNKMSPAEHQKRAKESYARLQKDVKSYLDKKQFPRVSNELSLQIGNLRYDLRQIASAGDKAARKAAEKESKQALKALETLDQYARQNKANEANQAYADALQKLGNLVKAYG
ncbi:hypothetical protein WJX73_004435 [Symbiochloris irregularis]|uniref:Uncharacterized protein n=1 Tax=Symbiochloris irregularis TaxID=706552 RepID=A0AAW1PMK0_9CHLO